MIRPLHFAILVLATSAAAVAQQAAPKGDARVAHSRDSLPTVETSVHTQTRPFSHGDPIELIVTATNHGSARVQVGIACGPSLDVIVQYPDGTERSALWDSIAPDTEFTCEGRPSHWAEPGQTLVERILWRAPAHPATYRLRAALRRGDGLGNLSPFIDLTLLGGEK